MSTAPMPRAFNILSACENIRHGVFSRSGGVSTPPFDTLNVGLYTGDKTARVFENRERIALYWGMKPVIYLDQVHSDAIRVIKKMDNDLAIKFEPGKNIYQADGMITDISGIFLAIQVADCQAVMMYDPFQKVIANVHSGWKSSIRNIIGQCVKKMKTEFNSRPEDIVVGISPSLGPCCAEFIHYKTEIPEAFHKYRIQPSNHFDFWQMSLDQLLESGVPEKNIENMGLCTKCNHHAFFSYRKANITGRFACVIGMIEPDLKSRMKAG